MSLRKLPKIETIKPPKTLAFEEPATTIDRFHPEVRAAVNTDISVYGRIGDDFSGEGITARRIAAALRSIGEKDVTVSINSPGGDFFEGVAIYNLLREHKAEVNVKVVGLAASAASVIAMAGDNVQVAKSGFLMIHNAWAVVMGNRQDLAEAIEVLEPFDEAMAGVYADRTGLARDKIEQMMSAETWLGGERAVSMGFADALLAADEIKEDKEEKKASALRKLDNAMARSGMSRAERRDLLKEFTDMPSAISDGMPRAAEKVMPGADLLLQFTSIVKGN